MQEIEKKIVKIVNIPGQQFEASLFSLTIDNWS